MIHLAFSADFSSPDALSKAVAEESAAIAALGEALVGSGRLLVTVSGTPLTPGRPSTEADRVNTEGLMGGRGRAVPAVLGLASRCAPPGTVHRNGRLRRIADQHCSAEWRFRLSGRRRTALAGRARA